MMRNINNKRKFVVGAYLSRKKGGFYNTYHKLLSEKWIVTIPISRVINYITPISTNICNIPPCGLY